ncbi:MAG: rRNA-processing protein and EBNA1-binding protein ebp2 [Geoglossum umbratile]|nr:MAG: rRNA-processing protein and EBNA1-binding protein ebp2 [Geoglossum umbratile]
MAKKSKLLAALDAHQGKDYKLEHQRKLAKTAAKAKKLKNSALEESGGSEDATDRLNGVQKATSGETIGDSDGRGADDMPAIMDISRIDDSESESESSADTEDAGGFSESGEESSQAQDEDIPLSDIESLSSEERGDVVPHQRLTINNTSALLQALKSIALPVSKLHFSEHQIVTSSVPSDIPDVNDDLNRELAFYKQSLDAVKIAQNLLKKEGVPFTRPTDYFAEMVKSDEHMGTIKKKMMDEAAGKKAAAEARKQRDLRKFGKQVQVAKLQERDKAKRDTMEKIQILKRKRRGTDAGETNEDDLFDVALEDASRENKRDRASKSAIVGKASVKRQKRDQKFGFGGKKRFSKSGDAASSGDIKDFSVKRMKGQRKAPQRLGKSRRAKQG